MGIKDYSNYTPDQWYWSTSDEIDYGHVPQGGSLIPVLTDYGGNVIKELVTAATLNQAYLRDWQSWDSGVLADIWVRTAASEPQSVSYTGSPSVDYEPSTGVRTYTFSGGGGMNVHTYNGSGNTVENANYSGSYRVKYNVSTATPIMATLYYEENGTYKVYPGNLFTGYHKSTLTVTGKDTGSGSAILDFTPSGGAAGSVAVTPYKPEMVARKVLQPASLNAEKTQDRRWAWHTRVPSSATAQTKTFLVQGGTTALQTFAFDMEE